MRIALASLIVFGLAGSALAQEPATDAPPAPAAPAAAPAVPAAPAAAPAAAPPARPTTGDGAVLLDVIERVCQPLVRGGEIDSLAKGYGLKKTKNGYTATLGAKPYSLTLAPQGSNKQVCELTVDYAVGQEKPIISALNIWAYLHQPELKLQRSDIIAGGDGIKRTTTSWEYYTSTESTGLVFVQQRKTDDTPVGKNADRATLLYSERK